MPKLQLLQPSLQRVPACEQADGRLWRALQQVLAIGALLLAIGCNSRSKLDFDSAQPKDTQPSPSKNNLSFQLRQPLEFANCGYENGRSAELNTILEIVGGGVACIDFDRDGICDLLFPRGGGINSETLDVYGVNSTLLRGTGRWQFAECTSAARVSTDRIYSHGVTAADFDHDGFIDMLVYGYAGAELLINQGDGTFLLSEALPHHAWTTAAAWIDLNRDQHLDLFLGSYVDWEPSRNQVCPTSQGQPDICSPNVYEGVHNRILMNQGDGTFQVTEIDAINTTLAKSLGVVAAEFQAGAGVGLYIANDLVANSMYSLCDAQWVEHGYSSGVAVDDGGVANGSMGVALLDFNQDLVFDLFVTNFEHEMMALYEGLEGDLFRHASRQQQLNHRDLRIVGFGVVAADFDGDSYEDIVVTSGHVHYHPDQGAMAQLPLFLRNEQGKGFSKLTSPCDFFDSPTVGRGLATGDFDNDGDLDLVATNLLGHPTAVENTNDQPHRWLELELIGTTVPRTPIGATVQLEATGKQLIRQQHSGGSYLSQSQPILHFSWPASATDADSVQVIVNWPGQAIAETIDVQIDRRTVIVQSHNSVP